MKINLLAASVALVSAQVFAAEFNIRDYGAVGDGQAMETKAVQRPSMPATPPEVGW